MLAYFRLIAFAERTEQLPIRDLHHLDELVGSHIEEMWDTGEPKSWSSDVVAGVQHFLPSARNNLAVSWPLIQAWKRRELPCRALPLAPELTAALARGVLHAGFPRLAAGIVVGFDTLARTGELLNLVVEDVLVDASSGFAGVLRFRETKAGARQGVDQSVTIVDSIVRGALRYLCKDLGPGSELLQITDRKFRQVWKHVVTCLGLQDLTLRPYSMRRGGATWTWWSTLSYDAVAHRGRWASLPTCKRYIEDAASDVANLRFTDWQRGQLSALGECYRIWTVTAFVPDADAENGAPVNAPPIAVD